jgi:hypothetical protein
MVNATLYKIRLRRNFGAFAGYLARFEPWKRFIADVVIPWPHLLRYFWIGLQKDASMSEFLELVIEIHEQLVRKTSANSTS